MKNIILCATLCAALFSATEIYAIIDITGIKNATVYTEPGVPPHESPDGAIDITANGNATPFTFLWSNGATTEDIGHLLSGTYTVTVTNAFGCTKVLSATVKTCEENISPVPVITITNYTIIPISPFSPTQTGGGVNITVTSTLGSSTSGELYYKWVNQQTQQIVSASKDLVNVGPGTYCVTISGRCATQSACYIIPACAYAVPGGLFHLAFAPAPKPCPKQPNGGIDLTVSGPPAPYAYSWSNSTTIQDLTNVKAGTYVVKVTDANGCFYSEAYTLHDAIEEVSLLHIKHYCSEESKGKIEIRPMPAGNYQYNWSNGVTGSGASFLLDNLVAGQYCVTVIDPVSNCWTIKCWTISDGLPLESVYFETLENTSCSPNSGDQCVGRIILSVNEATGGAGPFIYTATGPGSYSSTSINGELLALCKGDYTIVVANADGCTVEKSATICCCPRSDIDESDCFYNGETVSYYRLRIQNAVIVPPSAANNLLGSIDLSLLHGYQSSSPNAPIYPLYFMWSKEGDLSFHATTGWLHHVPSGVYCVTATDGCSSTSACYDIGNYVESTVKPSCPGGSNGAITVTFAAGSPTPISLQWPGGSANGITGNSYTIPNLATGTYTVTIVDNNNFTYYTTGVIMEEKSDEAYGWPFHLSNFSPFSAQDQCFRWDLLFNPMIVVNNPCVIGNPTTDVSFNLGIQWPDDAYSSLTINPDGSSNVSGPNDWEVDENGSGGIFTAAVFDEQGCRLEYCFEFGYEYTVPSEGSVVPVQLPGTTTTINAYTGCHGCKQCGTQDCSENSPSCSEITEAEEFEYMPNNVEEPCTGGGTLVLHCASEDVSLEIPYIYAGVEYYDFSTPIIVREGVCSYNGGCLFEHVPNYPAVFKDDSPLYVKIKYPEFSCDTPPTPGGGTSNIACNGSISIQITDETTCTGDVFCYGLDGIHISRDITLDEYILTNYTCKRADGYCFEQTICSVTGYVMNEVEVPCPPGVPDCPIARPASERGTEMEQQDAGKNAMWVFPVPFTNYIYVRYNAASEGLSEITITDIAGRTIYRDQLSAHIGDNSFRIDFSDEINPGTYFVALKRPDGVRTVRKLIGY